MAALDPDASAAEVDLRRQADDIKEKLEVLLGAKPGRPWTRRPRKAPRVRCRAIDWLTPEARSFAPHSIFSARSLEAMARGPTGSCRRFGRRSTPRWSPTNKATAALLRLAVARDAPRREWRRPVAHVRARGSGAQRRTGPEL